MINDKLLQLKTIIAQNQLVAKQPGSKINVIKLSKNYFLPQFKIVTTQFDKHQQKIDSATTSISYYMTQFQKATTPQQQKKISKQVNQVLKGSQKTRKEVQDLIRHISQQLKKAQQNQKDYDPQLRIKQNSVKAWNSAVMQSINKLSKAQKQYKIVTKAKVTRQIRTINPDLSNQQLQKMAQDPASAQVMMEKQLIGASQQLTNRLCDIQDKVRDIKYLARCVDQLYELTVEMARLVAQTGQRITTIEQDLISAKDYTIGANQKLEQAKQHHKAFRKKVCCFILIGIIVIAAVLAPILITQIK